MAWSALAGAALDDAAALPPEPPQQISPGAFADCETHRRSHHDAAAGSTQSEQMARELLAYQALVEEALALRAGAIALLDTLHDKIDRKEALSGQDLKLLNQGAAALLAQRAALLEASLAHECWLDRPVPADAAEARIQRTGIALSLSAALVLYDNYLSAVSLYRDDSKLRKQLNRADRGYALPEGELNRIAASFASPANRQRVRRGLKWFEAHGADPAADDGYRYLVQLIEQSPSRHIVRQARPAAFAANLAAFFGLLTVDLLSELKDEGINLTSLLFGNAVGLVESRRGKLDGNDTVRERVASALQAGDILVEKTPFRLTDTFIPGYWGHVAVWVGSESELRALGIWDHPVVRPYQARIRTGRGVVEALRSGVEMNPLSRFLNIDDLGVLRQRTIDDATRAQVILQTLRQVGKAYDFNFDVESTHRIVCSELVYHAYTHFDWPTVRRLGRATISPDNVAVRATADGPLRVALLFRDGEEVRTDVEATMSELVDRPVVALAQR